MMRLVNKEINQLKGKKENENKRLNKRTKTL